MLDLARLTVTQKAELSLRGGHPWVFGEEVLSADRPYENGDLVHVFSGRGRYLGTGFVNDASKIRVRIISKNANDRFDDAFFERRLRYAVDYRRSVMGEDFSACRLIFGEADFFPGLTVDRFGNVLVVEILSLGMERRRDFLILTLVRILRESGEVIDTVYERSDSDIRRLEGMERRHGYYLAEGLSEGTGRVLIREGGIAYAVDYEEGQKTGFFLDQKYNRAAVEPIARDRRVLDCFTHTGSFGLHCARAGAAAVTSVDISEEALASARENAALNGLSDKITYVRADAFAYLEELCAAGGHPYDFIILDPPAFTKSRDTLKNAIRGYREINTGAMRLLPAGGYLATCSCSRFMTETYFRQMLHNAAEDAGVRLRQIGARGASPDHPMLWGVPETCYLKFYIFQIVRV